MVSVAVAFTPVSRDQNPNRKGRRREGSEIAYYRAMTVAYASVLRWNRADLHFISDQAPPEPFRAMWRDMGVKWLETDFEHRPPTGFWPHFNASLFTIDALRKLSQSPGDATVLLIDPDCVCIGSLDGVVAAVREAGFAAYPTGIAPDEVSNGLNAWQAGELHRRLDPGLGSVPPVHYGGECYAFVPGAVADVLTRVEQAWEFALDEWRAGNKHFVTEEHLLNYALRRGRVAPLDDYVRRIWTAPVYRSIVGDEATLCLWHLPAEKDRGLADLYSLAVDKKSAFWTSDREQFVSLVGRAVGIPHRSANRWVYDNSARRVRQLQRMLGRSVPIH